MKASPEQQALLLQVQELDTRVEQTRYAIENLPQTVTLADLARRRDELRAQALAVSDERDEARTELTRAESDVELVEQRIARDQQRQAQSTSSKDAQALTSELDSLVRRRSDLEDIVLALMERDDEVAARLREAETELADVEEELDAVGAERERELESLEQRIAECEAERAPLVERIPGEVVELYERLRARYGIGAALLRGGVSLGSNVRLADADLDEIRRAAPDEIMTDPVGGCILVRTEESGL